MPVTFEVDEVVPAEAPAPTVPLRELVGEHAFLGVDPELPVLAERSMHPLLGAVHHAFVDHRPLVLSPDAVWLTIAQGVAQHVRLHAEALRPRLVAHAGKQTLEVQLAAPPASAADWGAVVARFRAALAGTIGEGRARLLTCDFSTTGDAERVASEIVLMDVLASYFDYAVSIVCGIPRITLLGTADDWRSIRTRIDVIAELDLEAWARSLRPIADQLVAAASGRADVDFFQRIYKPRSAYGWDRVTGWIARLYPYVQSDRGDYSEPNPLLALALDHEEPETDGYYQGVGIRTCDPPSSASRVLLRLEGAPASYITLEGGLLAVEQTPRGELVPRAGYVVREAQGAAPIVERLRDEHGATSGHPDAGARWHHDAELRAFFEAIGTCELRLGDATWTILPFEERSSIELARERHRVASATRVIDLGDGTILAVSDERHVVRLRSDRLAPAPPRPPDDPVHDHCDLRTDERMEAIPVLAPSLLGFLARTLRDGVDLRSTTTLMDLSPDWYDTTYHVAPLFDRLRREGKLVEKAADDATDPLHGLQAITVGTSTWRRFEEPREWRPGKYARNVHIASDDMWAEPLVDLGDGTLLARITAYRQGSIVLLSLAAIQAVPVKRRLVNLQSSQPGASIPVLGRHFIDVLTFALAHDRLPRPIETLADVSARRGPRAARALP